MKSKLLNVLSFLLVLTAGVAAYADKIAAIGLVPEKLAWLWPFILIGSAALNRIALIVGDVFDDWELNNSFRVLLLALIPTATLAVLLGLGACSTGPDGRQRFDPVKAERAADGASALLDLFRTGASTVPSLGHTVSQGEQLETAGGTAEPIVILRDPTVP